MSKNRKSVDECFNSNEEFMSWMMNQKCFDEVMEGEIYSYLVNQDFNVGSVEVEIFISEDYGHLYEVSMGIDDEEGNYLCEYQEIYPIDLGTITFPLDILVDDLVEFLNDNDIDY